MTGVTTTTTVSGQTTTQAPITVGPIGVGIENAVGTVINSTSIGIQTIIQAFLVGLNKVVGGLAG